MEEGSSCVIIRKGKPVARIIPFYEKTTGWKRENKKVFLKLKKTSLEYFF
ncbi:MAG: hypothetical protein OEV66_07510 [Spirochaetia bacterium]|nr:hypothetical protein [Spirochaetia bacterium]